MDRLTAAELLPVSDAELEVLIVDVLSDDYRPGAPPTFSPEQIAQIISLSCEEPETLGLPVTHWTPGELAREAKKRKVHAPAFKAKVGLEAVRGMKTINEIGQEYGVHPVQVGQWKKEIQEQAKTLFEGKRGPKPMAAHQEPELLYSEIGKLKVELDWLKKKSGMSRS